MLIESQRGDNNYAVGISNFQRAIETDNEREKEVRERQKME